MNIVKFLGTPILKNIWEGWTLLFQNIGDQDLCWKNTNYWKSRTGYLISFQGLGPLIVKMLKQRFTKNFKLAVFTLIQKFLIFIWGQLCF